MSTFIKSLLQRIAGEPFFKALYGEPALLNVIISFSKGSVNNSVICFYKVISATAYKPAPADKAKESTRHCAMHLENISSPC